MSVSNSAQVSGPAWDLSDEYKSPDDSRVEADFAALADTLEQMRGLARDLTMSPDGFPAADSPVAGALVESARELFSLGEAARRMLGNLSVFASCLLSVDANDSGALALQGRLQSRQKDLASLLEALGQFLARADEALIARYLDDPRTAPAAFQVGRVRARSHELLNLSEENLVSALSQDGIHAWGRMYNQISGTLRCEVEVDGKVEQLGVAQASGLMQRPEESVRQTAWRAVSEAWRGQFEPCAAAVNAIAGWRLELCRKRSHTQPVHYLDSPLHANRITAATLDTLLAVCEESVPLARRAATAMARASGREQLGPWDLRAPAPALGAAEEPHSFEAAIELIADAYGDVDGSLADFVRMMANERWVEGRVTPHKRPGAYCTRFAKSRNPRVYMTYTGSSSDIITLAHELGHAYHGWVMRDLPESQREYGMSLAETASTFGETVVRNALIERADSAAGQFQILWEEVAALPTFLLNIPVRFDFERNFYDARDARPQRPDELAAMMSSAWAKWYGETMCESDPTFWASKLHFYISGLSFYNFPYLFGYLFSNAVYLRREQQADDFFPRYVELLRDTGRMDADAVCRQHLDASLDDPAFWRNTINGLQSRVERFENLVQQLN